MLSSMQKQQSVLQTKHVTDGANVTYTGKLLQKLFGKIKL
jgi:hypothetical protein